MHEYCSFEGVYVVGWARLNINTKHYRFEIYSTLHSTKVFKLISCDKSVTVTCQAGKRGKKQTLHTTHKINNYSISTDF